MWIVIVLLLCILIVLSLLTTFVKRLSDDLHDWHTSDWNMMKKKTLDARLRGSGYRK
ncbi:hypothetical protein HBP99_04195 [Listeria booriae]|uniref:hypothetical protein n=1 Tax=Listeria booriae TaxID=1552123 RepID=UPI001627B1DF|nr:hypothetical protein [Listeria booriae]MBC2367820.1 hypothetical protein [Listeria booriae]